MALVRKYVFEDGCNCSSTYKLVAVKVGDVVHFKSDYEQAGLIVEIKGDELVLENEDGFGGDYLRYATRTTVWADDCWVN